MKSIDRFLPCVASLALAVSPVPSLAQTAPGGSKHFEAVSKHLDQGGLFYTYVDIDGDAARFAGVADALLDFARKEAGGAIPPGLSAKGILQALGLDRVKAIGMSSRKAEGTLFQNRALIYLPEGRAGIFKLFGGAAAPLQAPGFAPAGSDLVLESELTLSALQEVAEAVLRSTGDPQMLEQFKGLLGFPVPGLEMTAGDLISRLNTRILVAGRLEKGKTFTPPGSPSALPAFRLVVSFDDLDFLFAPIKEIAGQSGAATLEQGEGFELIRPTAALPEGLDDFKPVLYHDLKSKRLLLSTHLDAVEECLAGKQPLSGDPGYAKATEGLPKDGNEFSYITPAVFETFQKLMQTFMAAAPSPAAGPNPEILKELMAQMETLSPLPTHPLAGVRANLPEGMLFQSNSTSSFKSIVALAAVVPVAFVATAATGIAAPLSRISGEAKPEAPAAEAPPEEDDTTGAIRANLQQIAFAAQTYFLDHADAAEVSYEQLIKAELLFRVEAVNGESYKGLKLKKAGGTLSVKRSGGDSVDHKYGPVTD